MKTKNTILIIGAIILLGAGSYFLYQKSQKGKEIASSGKTEEQKIQEVIDKIIKPDPKWMEGVNARAVEKGVSVAEQLIAEAKWKLWNDTKKV